MFKLRDLFFSANKVISKNVLALALPVIASNLSRVIMNMADVAMVGRLGAPALAATGMGSMLVWTVVSFCIGLRTATQTVSSRRLGQKKYDACGTALHNGHILAVIYGVPISLAGYYLSKSFVPFFINDGVTTPLCVEYTSIAFLGVLFSAIGFVFQGFYTGVEKTSVHMKVTITANLINVYLNAGLIYGREGLYDLFSSVNLSWLAGLWSWYDFPALGVKGAAIATLVASFWLSIHYSYFLFKPTIYKKFNVFSAKIDLQMLKRQIKLALPQGSQELVVMFGFAVFYKIVGLIGVIELAAIEVVFIILQSSFMPAVGIGQACATLVGKHLGEKDPDKAEIAIKESVRWSFLIMGFVGILFLFLPQYIIPVFTNDPQVLKIGIDALRIAALVQFVDAFGLTLWFALSGAGNTVFPATVEAVVVWGFFLPGSYIAVKVFGTGFLGPWSLFVVYIIIFAVAMIWKINKGDWKLIDV